MHDGAPPTEDEVPPADGGGAGQHAEASSSAIIVQAARDATINLTRDLVLPDAQVRLVEAQAETIEAQRRLIAVMEELNDARRLVLESAQVEHRSSQVIVVLRVVLIRLSALIARLAGERDRYLAEATGHRAELAATRGRLSAAEQERGRAQGQLGQAQEEHRRATVLAEAAHARILQLEATLRRAGIHDPGLPAVGSAPAVTIPSHDDVLHDTAAGLDQVQRLLDEQERELADLEADGGRVAPRSRVLELGLFLDELGGILTGRATRVGLCHVEIDGASRKRRQQVLAVARDRLVRALPESAFLTGLSTGFVIAVAQPRDDAEVIGLARRLQVEVAAPIPVTGAVLILASAVGIVTRDTARSTVNELLRDARAALDAAKRRGPNQWALFGHHHPEAPGRPTTHDELTGLPNRALVEEVLTTLLDSEDRSQVAVLFCDIDNFKRVNDSLGHDAGDELLVALARLLEGGLPEGCTAARLSGDEYVIICENLDQVGGVDALATKVAGLLRTALPVRGQVVGVSASIGAAVPHGPQVTANDLLRFADAAMFEAKRSGAGRVSLASAALIASADRQVHLEGQLRDALAHDGLALHFQPVVGVDGSVQTAEALVRWPHPDRGLLPPDAFLPVAEEGDLLRALDRWVLRTALKEAATWPAPNDQPVSVAVNLGGVLPGDPEFVDIVADAIAEAGIPWDRVVLELVEDALMGLPSRVRQSMDELVGRGIRFAVDDFGTGYSSLARLKDLPAQIIKVDRRFVSGPGTGSSDFAVAQAIVEMAGVMGRKCVAEGVETAAQFHVLRRLGVDAFQGWLFSRPVPAEEVRAVLAMSPLHVPREG